MGQSERVGKLGLFDSSLEEHSDNGSKSTVLPFTVQNILLLPTLHIHIIECKT